MFRTALKPRWLALLVVVLIVASGMAALGNWQLDRARERSSAAVREKLRAQPLTLNTVLHARESFPGRLADAPVVARGAWGEAPPVLIAGRTPGGTADEKAGAGRGYWVLTPFVLADGSAVPVVRGWVADPAAIASARLPTGPVEVTGVLRPGESSPDRDPGESTGLPAGQLRTVDPAELVKLWPQPLLTGYIVATDAGSTAGLTAVDPTPAGTGGYALQNLSYALQWWIFAALGLFFWWRLVRDDARGGLPRSASSGSASSGPASSDPPASSESGLVGDDVAVKADQS